VDWCEGQDCICASACALIWFGAVEREGEVGLHRPTTEDPVFRALAPAEAASIYRKILGSVTAYLDDMEVPKPMVDVMVSTSSSEIRWIDSDTDGLRRPPSIAEWEDASCGSFTSEERSAFYKLAVKTNRGSQEQLLVKMLQEKLENDGGCRASSLDAQRGRVPSP
jgi:formylglycine-generating enzyme required for sulfatase activity